MTSPPLLTDTDFARIRRFIFDAAGISFAPSRKALVTARLAGRVAAVGLRSFAAYLDRLDEDQDEARLAIDLLTTHETYFFREPGAFELLRELALQRRRSGALPLRAWSAASSSGEEAYSMAMVLEDCLGPGQWEVFGTDVSARVLRQAQRGRYVLARCDQIPPAYLRRFCLRGTGESEGKLLVDRGLRERVTFLCANLNETLPPVLGPFDVIFLRNVLIYFDQDTRTRVVSRVIERLKPDGALFLGHAESLNGLPVDMVSIGPAAYRRPTRAAARSS